MKRFLCLLMACAALSACHDDHPSAPPAPQPDLVVERDGATVYTENDLTWRLDPGEAAPDGTRSATLYMDRTRFVEGMPYLDMEVRALPVAADGSIAAERIVPHFSGRPMDQYALTRIEGRWEGATLRIAFDCIGYRVRFEGSVETL